MGHLKLLVTHCLETPDNMYVTPDMIDDWHRAPRKNKDGTITYMGKTYSNLGAADIDPKYKNKWGRGWDRLGYSDIMHIDGSVTNITPYDEDGEVESHEMTWGASGINSISRHIGLEGGKGEYGLDSLSDAQIMGLQRYYKKFLFHHSKAKIAGHNQFSKKKCPNFEVAELCRTLGIPEENIYKS